MSRSAFVGALSLLLAAFAGCAGGEIRAEAVDGAPDVSLSPQDPGITVPILETLVGEPRDWTLHLIGSAGLSEPLPPAGSLNMAGSYAKCDLTPPCPTLVFNSPPAERDLIIHPGEMTFRLWFQSTAPVLHLNFFDIALWFGTSRGVPVNIVHQLNAPIMPGAPVKVEFARAFEESSVLVPKGETFRLIALSGTLHEESGILKLLVGGETPSSVSFRAGNYTTPTLGPTQSDAFTGTIPAPGFPLGDPLPDEAHLAIHKLTVGPAMNRLEFRLEQTGGQYADIDLDVLDGTSRLGGSHTPFNKESVLLGGPEVETLRGKELTLRVSNFFGAQVPYKLTVDQR